MDLFRFKCSMCGAKDAWLYTAAPERARKLRYPLEDYSARELDDYVECNDTSAWDDCWIYAYEVWAAEAMHR